MYVKNVGNRLEGVVQSDHRCCGVVVTGYSMSLEAVESTLAGSCSVTVACRSKLSASDRVLMQGRQLGCCQYCRMSISGCVRRSLAAMPYDKRFCKVPRWHYASNPIRRTRLALAATVWSVRASF